MRPTYVYFVAWPDDLVKVGQTACWRWIEFVRRGARLELLAELPNERMARDVERDCLFAVASISRPAFRHRKEAALRLGKGGLGWTECFFPDDSTDAWIECLSIMRGHPYSRELPAMDVQKRVQMHGRTHGRTHAEPPSALIELAVVDAHARRQEVWDAVE